MEGSPFDMFGDPEELRARMQEMADQMRSSQQVAWADNAIRLAVEMTVAAINRLELSGGSDEAAALFRESSRVSREVVRVETDIGRLARAADLTPDETATLQTLTNDRQVLAQQQAQRMHHH